MNNTTKYIYLNFGVLILFGLLISYFGFTTDIALSKALCLIGASLIAYSIVFTANIIKKLR